MGFFFPLLVEKCKIFVQMKNIYFVGRESYAGERGKQRGKFPYIICFYLWPGTILVLIID